MAQAVKVVAPRLQTPTGGRTSRRTTSLPDELVSEQIERLALFAAVVGALWAIGLFVEVVLFPLTWGRQVSMRAVGLEIFGIASAAFMYWMARYCTRPGQTKTDVSLGYLVLNRFACRG